MEKDENGNLFKPFYLVERLTGQLGVEITYAYDDIVFIEHSAVLLQFDPDGKEILRFYINADVEPEEETAVRKEWMLGAEKSDVALEFKGKFALEQIEGEEQIKITFL